MEHKFDSIESTLEAFAKGEPIVVMDDPGRENEGDVIFSAEKITTEKINFLIQNARGLICVPIKKDLANKLGFFSLKNKDDHEMCNFTVSVDAKENVKTGISAKDRKNTILKIIDKNAVENDFDKPGHIFPIVGRKGGVLVRAGHTEAAIDLASLAGLYPASVICEIIKDDGSMARKKDLFDFAKKHNLKIITIEDLIAFRRKKEKLIKFLSKAKLPTKYGDFDISVFLDLTNNKEHIVLTTKNFENKIKTTEKIPMVRVHSECITGNVFGSKRCDCDDQLKNAMQKVSDYGFGAVLYMREEGRGIGLSNKIKAYKLQDKGMDTVEANEKLGFDADLREYGIGAQILSELGLHKIKLLTNNPKKIIGLKSYNLEIIERIAIEAKVDKDNKKYLKTKKDKMGHLLDNI